MADYWGMIANIGRLLKDAAPLVKAGVETYSAYQQVSLARQAKERADQSQTIRNEEIRRNRELSTYAAQREARVKKAQLLASGIQSSTVLNSVTGINTTLAGSLKELDTRTDFNLQSSNIQGDAESSQAQAALVEGVTSGIEGGLDFSGEFTDFIKGRNNG